VLRVTADTNVIISGLNFSGNPRHVLEMAEDGAIHLAVSDAILDEVERVLRRDKFGWPEEQIDKAIRQIARFTEHVEPKQRIDAVKEDPTGLRAFSCRHCITGSSPKNFANRLDRVFGEARIE
jgi:uncharacterized protein